jgi:hypothetical protein
MRAKDVKITLDWVRDRCRIERDEAGREHWIWCFNARRGTQPCGYTPADQSNFYVRPAVYHLKHPTSRSDFNSKHVVCDCGVDLCVHPDCLKLRTRNAHQRGDKRPASWRAKISAAKRAQMGSPTNEQVRQVMAMHGTAKEISLATGIKLNAVNKIRAGTLPVYADPFSAIVAVLK